MAPRVPLASAQCALFRAIPGNICRHYVEIVPTDRSVVGGCRPLRRSLLVTVLLVRGRR